MIFVTSAVHSEIEVKKSKFISYLVPYGQFKQWQEKLKQDHPKARHIVYAYRYINEHDQIVENLTDDGEPKGSSGPPSLAALRGKELVNTAVLTVRYFGGIKLGIGGLVRAYGKSVNQVISCAQEEGCFETYEKIFHKTFTISLSHLAKFEHFIHSLNSPHLTLQKVFEATSCELRISAPQQIIEQIDSFFS